MKRKSLLIGTAVAAVLGAAALGLSSSAQAHPVGGGWGMMGGYGPGYGHMGYGSGWGYMGPGMMGGYGPRLDARLRPRIPAGPRGPATAYGPGWCFGQGGGWR